MQFPDLGKDLAAEQRDGYEQNLIATQDFAGREMVKILVKADRFLPAVLIDLLLEVAMPIKQTNGDEI